MFDLPEKEYIPKKAVSSGFMLNPCLRRVLRNRRRKQKEKSYAIQFHVKTRETY